MAARFLVISFQRSGLNWLRYCTEYFSGQRTPGRKQLIGDGPAFFDRAHDVRRQTTRSDYVSLRDTAGAEVYERVALLLRHPYHCFVSHYLGRSGRGFKKGLAHFEAYAANINEFDRLQRAAKGVFHFEDFVDNEPGTLAFLRFFDIDAGAHPYNFAAMIEASQMWYAGHHGIFQRKRPQLKTRERDAIHRMLQQELGENFEQYLGRYSFDD
jgi:hypothetical protein